MRVTSIGGRKQKNGEDPKKVLEEEIERLIRLAKASGNETLEHHMVCLEVCLVNMKAGR